MSSKLYQTFSVKLHYTDTGYITDMLYTTSPTDELSVHNNSATCCTTNSPPKDKNVPHPNIFTCRGSGIAMSQICCTTSCRIVVSLSVGGVVQHVRSRCPCSGVWHLRHAHRKKADLTRVIEFSLLCRLHLLVS